MGPDLRVRIFDAVDRWEQGERDLHEPPEPDVMRP